MVEINYKVVIAGIVALALMFMVTVICDHDSTAIGMAIVGVIAGAIGFVIPAPRVDNKNGVLKIW